MSQSCVTYLTIFQSFILPEFVGHLDKDRLYISNLPSLAEFERFYYVVNVRHWVNVSGIDVYQIYPELVSSDYSISQFDFADIFTDGEKLTDFSEIEKITSELYESVSVEQHRHALLEAVNAVVVQLENQVSTGIFCHRGLARSPLVAAAALNHFHRRSTRKRNASGAVYDDPRVAVGAGRVDGVGARAEA